jgi:RNA polymerase sigma-70 factor, ECF subfamily
MVTTVRIPSVPISRRPGGKLTVQDRTSEFVALLAAHGRVVYSYIMTLMIDHDATQEVYQETSLTLWQKFDEFQRHTNFVAWARRIAYFEVLKYRQNCRRDRLRFNSDLLHTLAEERAANEGVLQAYRAALPDCVAKLPLSDWQLIEQRYAGEETIQDIACRIGRPANTLYKALERIRRTLLKCMEEAVAARGRV